MRANRWASGPVLTSWFLVILIAVRWIVHLYATLTTSGLYHRACTRPCVSASMLAHVHALLCVHFCPGSRRTSHREKGWSSAVQFWGLRVDSTSLYVAFESRGTYLPINETSRSWLTCFLSKSPFTNKLDTFLFRWGIFEVVPTDQGHCIRECLDRISTTEHIISFMSPSLQRQKIMSHDRFSHWIFFPKPNSSSFC